MVNPYASPNPLSSRRAKTSRESARRLLQVPAIGLIAVSSISLFMALLTLVWDMALFASDPTSFDDLPLGQTGLVVKTVWGLIIAASNGASIWGGIQMLRLRQHQLCWLASLLACIPVIGPCFCLGIPFGAWAIIVLNKSDVADAFN